jgi:hypothetical protein
MMKSAADAGGRRSAPRTFPKNFRLLLCAGVICALALASVALPASLASPRASRARHAQHAGSAQPRPDDAASGRAVAFLGAGGTVRDGFESHMPIVLIDTGGREIPINQQFDPDKGYLVPIPGVDPFVPCELRIYGNCGCGGVSGGVSGDGRGDPARAPTGDPADDPARAPSSGPASGNSGSLASGSSGGNSGAGQSGGAPGGHEGDPGCPDGGKAYNTLADAPAVRTKAMIKRRGNSSHNFEKAQYKLKLMTDGGAENALPLLGMRPDDEWVLNGNMLDKSLMRNYFAMLVASEVMRNSYTPESRFCEVIVRDGGALLYRGVYQLTENVRQGPGRVDISKSAPGGGARSYLLKRDRFDPNRPMLRTYATEAGLSAGCLSLLYPKRDKLGEDELRYVEEDVSAAERVLYADDASVFMTYPNFIDVDSFVDYFVLNEFFGNYDAGWNSTYFYKELGGKLRAGPVWDFDTVMDNYKPMPMAPEEASFAAAPWFDRLIRHKRFLDRVLGRYARLRRGTLAPGRIDAMMQDIARYVGPAQQRDWMRWREIYESEEFALDETSAGGGARNADGGGSGWARYADGINGSDGGWARNAGAAAAEARPRRRTYSYEQEIAKLRYLVNVHGAAFPAALARLDNPPAGSISDADDYKNNSLLAIAALLVFSSSVLIARRHGNE